MRLPKPTISIALLMAANLTPLIGVFWFGWDAALVILVYWTENLIAGCYNVLRMLTLRGQHIGKLFMIPFFCVHFGGFCAVHGAILMGLLLEENAWESGPMDSNWPGPLIFLHLLVSVIRGVWEARPPGAGLIVACLVFSHGISFVHNHFIKRENAVLSLGDLMSRPYKRIVILHIAVLAGAVPILMLGSPAPLLVILIVLKTGLDIVLHARAHRKTAAKAAGGG
jgi:hypothetical protein